MPDADAIPRRLHALVLNVTQAAAEVSRLIHEAAIATWRRSPASGTGETRSSDGRFFSGRCCHD
jgi:hypothetical protein